MTIRCPEAANTMQRNSDEERWIALNKKYVEFLIDCALQTMTCNESGTDDVDSDETTTAITTAVDNLSPRDSPKINKSTKKIASLAIATSATERPPPPQPTKVHRRRQRTKTDENIDALAPPSAVNATAYSDGLESNSGREDGGTMGRRCSGNMGEDCDSDVSDVRPHLKCTRLAATASGKLAVRFSSGCRTSAFTRKRGLYPLKSSTLKTSARPPLHFKQQRLNTGNILCYCRSGSRKQPKVIPSVKFSPLIVRQKLLGAHQKLQAAMSRRRHISTSSSLSSSSTSLSSSLRQRQHRRSHCRSANKQQTSLQDANVDLQLLSINDDSTTTKTELKHFNTSPGDNFLPLPGVRPVFRFSGHLDNDVENFKQTSMGTSGTQQAIPVNKYIQWPNTANEPVDEVIRSQQVHNVLHHGKCAFAAGSIGYENTSEKYSWQSKAPCDEQNVSSRGLCSNVRRNAAPSSSSMIYSGDKSDTSFMLRNEDDNCHNAAARAIDTDNKAFTNCDENNFCRWMALSKVTLRMIVNDLIASVFGVRSSSSDALSTPLTGDEHYCRQVPDRLQQQPIAAAASHQMTVDGNCAPIGFHTANNDATSTFSLSQQSIPNATLLTLKRQAPLSCGASLKWKSGMMRRMLMEDAGDKTQFLCDGKNILN